MRQKINFVNVRFDPETLNKLDNLALLTDRTRSSVVRQLVRQAFTDPNWKDQVDQSLGNLTPGNSTTTK